MQRILSVFVTTALLGSSLLLGAGAAQAGSLCPPTMHAVDPATHFGSNCARNADQIPTGPIWSGTSNGADVSIWDSETPRYYAPAPANVPAPPPYKPLPQAPAVVKPPVAVPAAPARNAAPGASPAQGSYQAGQPGGTTGTTVPAQQAAAPADAPAAAPAEAAPAIVLPANEAQAVDALRSATATAAEKDAALAIVKTKINAVLDEAIGKALSNR